MPRIRETLWVSPVYSKPDKYCVRFRNPRGGAPHQLREFDTRALAEKYLIWCVSMPDYMRYWR